MNEFQENRLAEVARLARELMNQHGLGHWKFQFNRAKRQYGCCWLNRNLIEISEILARINPLENTKDTILHEIAHALAPAGVHHGPAWVRIAKSIGCNGERCFTSDDTIVPDLRFFVNCPCGKSYQRCKAPRIGRKYRCPKCKTPIIWSDRRNPIL